MADDGAGDAGRRALDYLQAHRVMTLATTGPLGVWAAAVFYVNRDFDLYFLSAGHTRHGQNLADRQWAAAAIQEDYADWPDIKGIQLEGPVRLLQGVERGKAIRAYMEKYPFLQSAGAVIQSAMARINWYHLAPRRFYFIDNSKGLGHRDEIHLPAATGINEAA